MPRQYTQPVRSSYLYDEDYNEDLEAYEREIEMREEYAMEQYYEKKYGKN